MSATNTLKANFLDIHRKSLFIETSKMSHSKASLYTEPCGFVQLPIFPRDSENNCYYQVYVNPTKLHKKGEESANLNAFSIEKTEPYRKFEKIPKNKNIICKPVRDLNSISDSDLKQFVVIDDGTFVYDRVNPSSIVQDLMYAQRLCGSCSLFNLSNKHSPLKVYRLKRIYSESPDGTPDSQTICTTFWDMQVIDHGSSSVPCSRSGHATLVVPEKDCLYLVGGATTLADKTYENPFILAARDLWFYYPLNDVWKLDLRTGSWQKLLSLGSTLWMYKKILTSTKHDIFPTLLYNISLLYDYTRDIIYGCLRPISCRETLITNKTSTLFAIDPMTLTSSKLQEYCDSTASTLAITPHSDRLFVIFKNLVYSTELAEVHNKELRKCSKPRIFVMKEYNSFNDEIPGMAYAVDDLHLLHSPLRASSLFHIFNYMNPTF